jgi:hypothetical protein
MRSHQGNNMKKVILSTILLAAVAQASDVVHYDTKDTKKPSITKPNHPTTSLYTK